MASSASNVALFLAGPDRPEDGAGATPFLRAEQALAAGHPLHPAAKSRLPMTPGEVGRYAPELGAAFPLHWFRAHRSLVAQGRRGGALRRLARAEVVDVAGQDLDAGAGGGLDDQGAGRGQVDGGAHDRVGADTVGPDRAADGDQAFAVGGQDRARAAVAEAGVALQEASRPGGQQVGPVDRDAGGQADAGGPVGHLGGKSADPWPTLTPMPSSTAASRSPSRWASASRPAALRPPSSRSLGHLRPAGAALGATSSTAAASATPAAATVSQTASRGSGGRSTTDSSSELPGGATQARPSRPRPSVCSSVTTVAPSGTPEAASSAALTMVVGTLAATSRG